MKNYYIYMIRCEDNSIYTGITTDLKRRFEEHKNHKGAKYTRNRNVLKIESAWITNNKINASKLEYHIKKISKLEKEKLIKTNIIFNEYLKNKINIENYEKILDLPVGL